MNVRDRRKDRKDKDRRGSEDNAEARRIASRAIINTEKFKATHKGESQDNVGEDDEFFHLTCHIDPGLKHKIEKGEFVDLEKLLPRGNRLSQRHSEEHSIKLVHKEGETFLTSADREGRVINGVR